MRGTAWPNGAYRQYQAYEDGALHAPVETISGVLHIRDTVFGHKWVYKLNETRIGAKLVFKRRFSIRYFVGIAAVLAVCLVICVAVVFAIFGPKYLYKLSSSENSTFTKLTSTVFNKTKIVFRIHTTSNFTRHKNTSTENKIAQEETTILPIEKDNFYNSTCDKCNENEICFQNTSTPYPECMAIQDKDDPTGCGGLCKLEVQFCKNLDSTLNIFSCIDIKTVICTEGFWKCENSLMCIAEEKKCDGIVHCFDKSDEIKCDCDLKENFQCEENIACIPFSKKCDGKVDCWDASDEKNCAKECEPSFVPCNIGECIPNEKFCDGQFDCTDKSDEPKGCFNNNATIITR